MELIVVLFIIGLMATFAVPNFGGRLFRDDTESFINWVVLNAGQFKKKARLSHAVLIMIYDPNAHTFRVEEEKTTNKDPEKDEADDKPISTYELAADIRIDDIRVNGKPLTETDAGIRFYPKGYSDHAVISLSDENHQEFTLVIEPFLQRVAVHQGAYRFD